jgi:antitoxin PrlF
MASVTSKGQVTIPKIIRDQLGIGERDRVLFLISADGTISIKRLVYPTARSLAGVAGALGRELSADDIDEARVERLRRKLAR